MYVYGRKKRDAGTAAHRIPATSNCRIAGEPAGGEQPAPEHLASYGPTAGWADKPTNDRLQREPELSWRGGTGDFNADAG